MKVQAIEENKRYNQDKTYKTEFAEGIPIYIDAKFVGMAKETYRDFSQNVKKENYNRHEQIKGNVLITDSEGKEVINKELEYG